MIGRVGDEPIYAEVVDDLARREGLDEAAAHARVVDTLRWVAARREALAERPEPPTHPDDLAPARARALEHAELVRLWLREHFEPSHRIEDIPAALVRSNLGDPSIARRLFHPDVWVICQVLIVPAEKGPDGRPVTPPLDGPVPTERWRARAEQALLPFATRSRRLEAELLASESCDLLARLSDTSTREFPSVEPGPGETAGPEHQALRLRYETFAFAPSEATNLDPTWVAAVTAEPRPRLVGPFISPFGLHLVLVAAIKPASLPDGSLPDGALRAAREAALREAIHARWREDELERVIHRARDEQVVRLAPGVD